MKKKILASLLAVAMMASLVVPAFADTFQPSSQSANDEDITALAFSDESVSVPNGKTDGVDLMSLLTAYAGNNKIVQNPTTLEWSINPNLALGLDDNGVVSAVEDSGSAVVTVKVPGKDITASIKVVATKLIEPKPAQGYKFDKTSYLAETNNITTQPAAIYGNVDIAIIPLSNQYEFVEAQQNYIKGILLSMGSATTLDAATQEKPSMKIGNNTAVPGTIDPDSIVLKAGKITFTFKANDPTQLQTASTNKTATFTMPKLQLFPKGDGSDKTGTVAARTVRVDVKRPIQATKIIRTNPVKIEVGQTADLSECYAITTGANFDKDVDYSLDFYNDSSTAYDYAVQSDEHPNIIRGIAVGKLKAIVTLRNSTAYTTIPIEVVARGTLKTEEPSKTSVSPATGALKVGETMTINAKGVADGKEVSWTPSNNNITVTMKTTGEGLATITGKVAGTTLLFARVKGDDGKMVEVGRAVITVAGADGTVPTTPPVTTNPPTGDSLFANLF